MKRYLDDLIARDLSKKMVFVTGPRQVGKTTLSRMLLGNAPGQYLNYDVAHDRDIILSAQWNPQATLLVLDEIHKMRNWKPWLKGVFDGKPAKQQLLVTGGARLDTFRHAGESLAGRFFAWRLHPSLYVNGVQRPGPHLPMRSPICSRAVGFPSLAWLRATTKRSAGAGSILMA